MHWDCFKLWKLHAEGFAGLRALSRTGNWISARWFLYYTHRCEGIRRWKREEESAREALDGFRMRLEDGTQPDRPPITDPGEDQ